MNLGDLITTLKAADPNQVVHHGFHNPHSYRGDYYDLAFEPATDITVAEMLEAAESAIGATYQGWKGGDFRMNQSTWCWLSEEGSASGETISPLLLQFMLTPPTDRSATLAEAFARIHVLADEASAIAHDRDPSEGDGGATLYAQYTGLRRALDELRRMADEAAVPGRTTDETRPPCPHCGLAHDLTPSMALACASIRASFADREQPAEEPMLGSPDCTCIPFTRQGGTPRYCGPTDTADQISGWEIGADCPHHRPAVGGAQQPTEERP
jgi:hypothetical protein